MHSLTQNYRINRPQTETRLYSKPHRAAGDSWRNRESGSTPRPNASHRLNWDLLAIWSFVAFSFAALCFAAYVIWAKCRGS